MSQDSEKATARPGGKGQPNICSTQAEERSPASRPRAPVPLGWSRGVLCQAHGAPGFSMPPFKQGSERWLSLQKGSWTKPPCHRALPWEAAGRSQKKNCGFAEDRNQNQLENSLVRGVALLKRR